MKATTGLVKLMMMTTLMVMVVGCGSSKMTSNGGSSVTTPPPAQPDQGGDDNNGGSNTATWPWTVSGAVASFVPVSYQELNSYVAIRPLNNPSDVRVNINMKKISGTSFYAGKVQIGYNDNGQFYYGSFSVGEGINQNCSNCRDNGLYEAAPNFWTTIKGKSTFMAYVQDQYGSLIIVMEPQSGGADGENGGLLKGRIYYRNFAQSLHPQSTYRKCWYIYSGPYACYANNMSQKLDSSDFSDGTYRLLGSFSGVRRDQALGQ
jgi:hypothetical protein